MTCAELQQVLPDIIEGDRSAEHEAHLQSCSACSGLISDLNLISQQARLLQASEEPSPRVWNSIEIALRQEGLIRQPQRDISLVPQTSRRWRMAWLAPVAVVLLIAFSVVKNRPTDVAVAPASSPAVGATVQSIGNLANANEDKQLLAALESRSPSMRADYEADLQNVNAYIRDAQESVQSNPDDDEARQSLMEAYDQRAMVYEMAMDRSLP